MTSSTPRRIASSRSAALTLHSGSPAAFEAHRDTLTALCTALHLGADVGLAELHDIALPSAMYGVFSGFLTRSAWSAPGAHDISSVVEVISRPAR